MAGRPTSWRGVALAGSAALVVVLAACTAGPAALPSATSPGGQTASSAPSPAPSVVPSPGASPTPVARLAFGQFDPAADGFRLFTIGVDGSDRRPLIAGTGEGPSWSPDGTEISVISFSGGDILKVLAPDGTLLRHFGSPTPGLGFGCGAWTPDGQRLVCEAWNEADGTPMGIYTIRSSDGGDPRRLLAAKGGIPEHVGQVLADGTILVLHGTDEAHELGELWSMGADGSGAHRLLETPIGWGISVAPDGRHLLTDREGVIRIYDLADLAAAPREIHLDGYAFGASWSPDGTRIALTIASAYRGGADIATMAADGTDVRYVTQDRGKDEMAVWVR